MKDERLKTEISNHKPSTNGSLGLETNRRHPAKVDPKFSKHFINRDETPKLTLGELYLRSSGENKTASGESSDITQLIFDLHYLGVFYYEDLCRRSKLTDFKSWAATIEDSDDELYKLIKSRMREIYYRSKAVFIGIELIKSGQSKYKKWESNLLLQLNQEERVWIEPYSQQIYEIAERIISENSNDEASTFDMNKKQRITIFAGLILLLLMLLLPPWKTNSGSLRGYYFLFYPPVRSITIDITRLTVQFVFVILLMGGAVYALQGKNK